MMSAPHTMTTMSDPWFSSKLAPNGSNRDGYKPASVTALEAYLHHGTPTLLAAQAITHPVATSQHPRNDLSELYVLLYDALVELPSEYISPLLALIQAIETLPEPDFTAIPEYKQPGEKLWEGLPHFANLWYDVSYRSGSWKMDAEKTSGAKRDELRIQHVRIAHVEARFTLAGLAGFPIGWGYEVVVDALEGEDVLLDFEVPAAAEWLQICGHRLWEGVEESEESYALDGRRMSVEVWGNWEGRLKELEGEEGVVGEAARRGVQTMRLVGG
jgi:hypothetical protein